MENVCAKIQRDVSEKNKSSSLCIFTEIWEEIGESECIFSPECFSITVLIFLFFFLLLLASFCLADLV